MYLQTKMDEKAALRYRRNTYLLKLGLTIGLGVAFYLVSSLMEWNMNPLTWHQFTRDLVLISTVISGVILTIID